MDSYTITITPDDDSGNSTTLTVDLSTGQARITSVYMQAPTGLTGGQVPGVDVGLLLQAVTGTSRIPTAITAVPTPVPTAAPQPVPVPAQPQPAGGGAAEPSTTAPAAAPQPATGDTPAAPPAPTAAPARRTSPRRAVGTRTAAGRTEGQAAPSSGGRRGRTQPAPTASAKAAPRKAARKQAAGAAGSGAERVYRRMPGDFAAVYRQAGTAAAIADHYGVPRHTAQGWIGRYKKQNADTTH